MVAFPGCKINLGLQVLAKRQDGYHDISTCYFPVPWSDVLEILPASEEGFYQTGLNIPGNAKDNLCNKAYELLQWDFEIPPIQLHLHKIIPPGSGLGGGSADAGHTLRTLNALFDLGISQQQLMTYAGKLGSDCTFFIRDHPSMGSGRGEILKDVRVALQGYYLALLVPPVHLSSAEAYSKVIPRIPELDIHTQLQRPVSQWKEGLANDFEPIAFERFPVLPELKEKLQSLGAIYSSMSGSGSSIYGIFEKEISLKENFSELSGWAGWL